MAKLLITVVAISATLFVVGMFSFQNQSKIEKLETSKDRGQLKWYAEMAKAKGEKEIAFPAPIVRYAVARSLDEAIIHYNVVIAEPLESKSYAGARDIQTWYKFRIIEELSTPKVDCTNCPGTEAVPADMLPLKDDEFLVTQFGGQVLVDGIRVVSKDLKFPPFENGKRYLLFLSLDSQKKVGALRMGPWGSFSLDPGEKLEAVDTTLKHPLKEEMTIHFGDSLARLRMRLKEESKPNRE